MMLCRRHFGLTWLLEAIRTNSSTPSSASIKVSGKRNRVPSVESSPALAPGTESSEERSSDEDPGYDSEVSPRAFTVYGPSLTGI